MLEDVNLVEFFKKSPLQLDTKIQKNGSNLSIGQAQRIGIARALLYSSKIIILDEFSAALDKENKLQIAEILLQLKDKITIIIVSHDRDIDFLFDYKIIL